MHNSLLTPPRRRGGYEARRDAAGPGGSRATSCILEKKTESAFLHKKLLCFPLFFITHREDISLLEPTPRSPVLYDMGPGDRNLSSGC